MGVCIAIATLLGVASVAASLLEGSAAGLVIIAVAFGALVIVSNDPRRAMLIVALMDIPLQLDTYINHDELIGVRGTTSGFNFSLTLIALVGLYALWFFQITTSKRAPKLGTVVPLRVPALAIAPLLLYALFAVASAVQGVRFELSIYELFVLAKLLLLYVYVIFNVRSKQDIVFIMAVLSLGLALESAFMFVGRAVGSAFSFAGMHSGVEFGESGIRVGGTLRNPNIAASYLTMSIGLAAGVVLSSIQKPLRVLAGLAIVLAIPALIFTSSRGGWLSALVTLSIVVFFAYRSKKISPIPLVIGGLIGVALLLVFQDLIIGRLLTDDRGSASARGPLNAIALAMWSDYPFLGIGINTFYTLLPDYVTPEFSKAWLSTVHNRYLLMLSETGPGGLLSFVGFMLASLWLAYQTWRENDPLFAPLSMGVFAAIAGQFVHMLVDTYRWRSSIQLMFVAAGVIVVMRVLSPALAARKERLVKLTSLDSRERKDVLA